MPKQGLGPGMLELQMFIQMFASHGRSDKTWVVVCALVSCVCVCGERGRGGMGGGKGWRGV